MFYPNRCKSSEYHRCVSYKFPAGNERRTSELGSKLAYNRDEDSFCILRVSICFGSFCVFQYHNYVHNFAFNPNFDVVWCIFIPQDSYNLLKVSSDHPNGAVTALGIVRPSAVGMQGARRVAKSTRFATFMSQQQLRKVELLYTLFRTTATSVDRCVSLRNINLIGSCSKRKQIEASVAPVRLVRHCSAYCVAVGATARAGTGNTGKGGLNTTANDPRSQMIPTFDHDQFPTANDFRILPQMVPTKNAEFRRLALQKVIIFLVYFSLPAWQREEVPCSTRDLQAAFSPLLASVTDAGWFSLRVKLYVVHGHIRRTQLWTRTHALRRHCSVT